MPFEHQGETIKISAEMSYAEYGIFLKGFGLSVGFLAHIDPRYAWLFLDIMNRFQDGNPGWKNYDIPQDRTLPISK